MLIELERWVLCDLQRLACAVVGPVVSNATRGVALRPPLCGPEVTVYRGVSVSLIFAGWQV